MEKTKRETHDFMKVESFSQLPFIRPAPTKEKVVGVKLFGIEFGSGDNDSPPASSDNNEGSESAEATTSVFDVNTKNGNCTENSETNRRFECHYCCRNFPTSQALGGHQNAHKRERQHAKRAHLQSAMLHGSLTESQVYGLTNYRQSSASIPAMTYPTWNNSSSGTIARGLGRIYGSHGGLYNSQRPINGNPLDMWRTDTVQSRPSVNRERLLPLFAGDQDLSIRASQIVGSSSQSRFSADCVSKPRVEDHVSLDLHL